MSTMKARRPDPAEIEFKNMRFLIMDRPTDSTIEKFIDVSAYSIQYQTEVSLKEF